MRTHPKKPINRVARNRRQAPGRSVDSGFIIGLRG
jgi:hypothetical protein